MYACSQKLHIIMDFATGGDLAGHIDKRAETSEHFSEEVMHTIQCTECVTEICRQTIRRFGAGLLQAVAFLHKNHVLQ